MRRQYLQGTILMQACLESHFPWIFFHCAQLHRYSEATVQLSPKDLVADPIVAYVILVLQEYRMQNYEIKDNSTQIFLKECLGGQVVCVRPGFV